MFQVDIPPTWMTRNGVLGLGLGAAWDCARYGLVASVVVVLVLVVVVVLVAVAGGVVCAEAIPTNAAVNSTSAAPSDMNDRFKVTLLCVE